MNNDTKKAIIAGCIILILILLGLIVSNRQTNERLQRDLDAASTQAEDASSAANDAASAAKDAASQAQDAQDRADEVQSQLDDLESN